MSISQNKVKLLIVGLKEKCSCKGIAPLLLYNRGQKVFRVPKTAIYMCWHNKERMKRDVAALAHSKAW